MEKEPQGQSSKGDMVNRGVNGKEDKKRTDVLKSSIIRIITCKAVENCCKKN